MCDGGHGRTGMIAAVLLSYLGVIPAEEDPIVYLRKIYCEKAVETIAQEALVYHLHEFFWSN
jgi:protein-tyrosine phosphatase